jgi:N,N'-diacetyllegionaminate synthase
MTTFIGCHGPLLIAEVGGNHEGDFEAAVRLADLAIAAGADAVKFQIYYGDTLVSAAESPDRNAHFKRFELTPAQHIALAERVLDSGRSYVASVWDLDAFGWIDPYMSAYKIGSGDLTAPVFLRAAAITGKPLILSTGLSSLTEVRAAVACIRSSNPKYVAPESLAVLQCTSMYPIANSDAHLSVMESLAQLGVTVGYSDHTIGWRALALAAVMGAQVLEFHFTDRKEGRDFRDHQLSLDSNDLTELIRNLDESRVLMGTNDKTPLTIEVDNEHVRTFRRAVYPSRDIGEGETLDERNLCVLRPNHGIDAREFYGLIGRRARRPLRRHEPLAWQDIE